MLAASESSVQARVGRPRRPAGARVLLVEDDRSLARLIQRTLRRHNFSMHTATRPDQFLADRLLMDEVWGPRWRGGEHILHVYIARLRKKVEDDPSAPKYLLTESGLGYRLATDSTRNGVPLPGALTV